MYNLNLTSKVEIRKVSDREIFGIKKHTISYCFLVVTDMLLLFYRVRTTPEQRHPHTEKSVTAGSILFERWQGGDQEYTVITTRKIMLEGNIENSQNEKKDGGRSRRKGAPVCSFFRQRRAIHDRQPLSL